MKNKIVLIYEIGSTTTLVNAFKDINTDNPIFLGSAQSPTTVLEGDVNIGLKNAVKELNLPEVDIENADIYASSSAAGGLKMSVHGLVYDMTAKAAKEAALGAGANIKLITAGKMSKYDIRDIQRIEPNIILLAGGVDYGERSTAIHNAEIIAEMDLNVPVIYAGNIENREIVKDIFLESGKLDNLYICDNVYPGIDLLNVEPAREIIQSVFEEHIVKAEGMENVRKIIKNSIMPTPGAVMKALELLSNYTSDVLCIDVGGATTDIHSVTDGSEENARYQVSPEPKSKRTVEGDLGVYVNHKIVHSLFREGDLEKFTALSTQEIKNILDNFPVIPKTEEEIKLVCAYVRKAVETAIYRHSGYFVEHYYSTGRKKSAVGKDLSSISLIIGTGGALTRLKCGKDIVEDIHKIQAANRMIPLKGYKIAFDKEYIMASLGVLSVNHPEAALKLLVKSLGVELCIQE